MKTLILTSLILSFAALAETSVPMKGVLKSYNEETFKVKIGAKEYRYDLSRLEMRQRTNLHLHLDKEISFYITADEFLQRIPAGKK